MLFCMIIFISSKFLNCFRGHNELVRNNIKVLGLVLRIQHNDQQYDLKIHCEAHD